ncbi:MAG TPA: hypothetical protein ENN23_10035 [Deltaproteobacteria bacterium]|nr:hypothetical protein [Deltaproteobacteria bacterium]
MRKYVSRIVTLIIIISFSAYIPVVKSMAQETGKPAGKKAAESSVKQLEDVLFEKLPGRERISLLVSEQPEIRAEGQTNGSLLVKLEDTSTPEKLRRNLGEGQLSNILRVVPSELTINDKQWTYLTIDIRDLVPYSIRQENKRILIDFNISGLPQIKPPAPVIAAAPPEKKEEVIPEKEVVEKAKPQPLVAPAAPKPPRPEIKPIMPKPARYTERKISVDFQEADIKSVLRLMAEYGQVSIVSGDDVKGNVTLSMRNVPWDQALETILGVHGLVKEEVGNVVTVMTLDRKRRDESTRKSAEEDQFKSELVRRDRERRILAEQGKLRQILIEAKIVEATEDFSRRLGVQWGFADGGSIGSYGLGAAGGSNTLMARSFRAPYPPEISTTGTLAEMAAVNLPVALASPTLGIIFGKGTSFLEAQLAALERTTEGKIISSPRVVTMDDVKAVIKQGDEVPYVTPSTSTEPPTVSFKEALLKLEVKPKITDEGRISMEIMASNDTPDWSRSVQGNPPIRKNELASTVVVDDGDTVVIGGVSRETDEKFDEGIPWFYKVPILGWLFKYQQVTKEKRQLMIFITPKILSSDTFAESTGEPITIN